MRLPCLSDIIVPTAHCSCPSTSRTAAFLLCQILTRVTAGLATQQTSKCQRRRWSAAGTRDSTQFHHLLLHSLSSGSPSVLAHGAPVCRARPALPHTTKSPQPTLNLLLSPSAVEDSAVPTHPALLPQAAPSPASPRPPAPAPTPRPRAPLVFAVPRPTSTTPSVSSTQSSRSVVPRATARSLLG
jgi:hypothetical protein